MVIRQFLRLESIGGILLMLAAVLALILDNSPASWLYDQLLDLMLEIRIGDFAISKPLVLWINDGLMAIFFLLIGLELKREVLDGELSSPRKALLPAFGALGGILAPAAIYFAFNRGDAVALSGWAIPTATDIAFALGILMLLGSRVPLSIKILLTAIAIVDDLAAIVIIAVFYTSDLALGSLCVALACCVALLILNRSGVRSFAPYIIVGNILWVSVLKSGVHATLAGVALAMAIPMRSADGIRENSPLRRMEHGLHPWVAFGVLPLFAFANAGVSLGGLGAEALASSVTLGIAFGLLIGKPVGVLAMIWLPIRLGWADRPEGANWLHLLGVALLAGVGFTMSFFIGGLAFPGAGMMDRVRVGVLGGSLLAGTLGYLLLRLAVRPAPAPGDRLAKTGSTASERESVTES